MATRTSPGRKPVGQVEEMAGKRRRKSNEFKNLIDNLEERFKKQEKQFEERIKVESKHWEQRFEEQQNQIITLTTDLRSSRRDIRAFSYCQILNTYLNIIKFAIADEPVLKKRRNSKQFQNKSSSSNLILFINTVYPDRSMSMPNILKYFQNVDSSKDQRDLLTHPRSIVELRDEARRFSAALEDHKRKGDMLNSQETIFLDVFSKIDELCAVGVGNLRL
jgi:hypothetical protein